MPKYKVTIEYESEITVEIDEAADEQDAIRQAQEQISSQDIGLNASTVDEYVKEI